MATIPARRCNRLLLLLPIAIVVGGGAFTFSCLFETPRGTTWAMGDDYARMAADPLGCHGPFPHRVLGPLVAHLLGLGGDRYWLFGHATVVLFLALVFAAAVWRGCTVLGGVVLTMAISVTGAVEVYKGHVGYAEPITYSILLASVLLTRRTGWFWVVQFLGLMNHENLVFFWPWLLYLKANDAGGIRRADLMGAAFVLVGYVIARWAFTSGASQPLQSFEFYWVDQTLSLATLGMWTLGVVSIVVYFGALPTVLAWQVWCFGWRRAGAGVCLALGAIFAMLCFAVDLQRFMGFLALPVILASIRLLQRARGVIALSVLGVVTAFAIVAQRQVVMLVLETMARRGPDSVSVVVTEIVPELWYVFLGYGGVHIAMLWAGRWYAQRWPDGESSATT